MGPVPPLRPRVVPDLLEARGEEDPEGIALVVHGGGSLTFGSWERRSNRVARGLAGHHVAAGDRIALLFDNARWTDFAVCYLAVHKAGAVAVPLAPRFSPSGLSGVLEHSGASALLSPPDLVPQDRPTSTWVATAAELEEEGRSDEPFQVPLAPRDLAEILYTSGTTGVPKGVACSHENVLFYEVPTEEPAASGPAPLRILHAFPVGSNAGQSVLRQTLRRGRTTAVALADFDPDQLGAAVGAHGVTRLQLVPAMARMILDSGVQERHDLSGIERVILSSAPLPPALLGRLGEVFPNAALWNAYALTESGTARTVMDDARDRPGSVGRPVGGTEVQVVNEEGRLADPGATGEVWLRRVGAPRREYYRDPEATAAAFVGDWLRTGDLGYLDPDGYLYLVDRSKDVIIRGGANVSSVDVENVLYEHPGVVEAAVFGVPHEVLGQEVAAAVVVRADTPARELQSFVRRRLAEHGTPHRVFFVDRLPRNASGKVLKRELVARFGHDGAGVEPEAGGSSSPPSARELAILAIWEELLGLQGLNVDDDFFALGGHSLAATQVAARLAEVFGTGVAPTVVFEFPTVAELAEAMPSW